MTPNQAFDILNLVALAAWVLLLLSPRLSHWASTVTGAVVPAVLATVYSAVVVSTWAGSEGGFSSLAEVAALFSNPWILLAGWTHYLAFDLLVGNWEMHDARRRGIPYVLVLPCLVLTFLFGPAGWLLYGIVRTARGTETVAQRAV
jgi:hypothetical protein